MPEQDQTPQHIVEEKVVAIPDQSQLKADIMSYVPLVITLIGLITSFGTQIFGWDAFPFEAAEIEQGIYLLVTVIGAVWSWFRNNNVTKQGLARESVANQALPKDNQKVVKEKA